jgi:hypothetical protein
MNDRTSFNLEHHWDHILRAEPGAARIDGEGAIPDFLGDFMGSAVLTMQLHGGVADQRVDGAIGSDRHLHHSFDVGLPRDIGADEGRPAAGFLDALDFCLASSSVNIRDDYARTLLRETPRDGAPNPHTPSGDDGNLVVQSQTRTSAVSQRFDP